MELARKSTVSLLPSHALRSGEDLSCDLADLQWLPIMLRVDRFIMLTSSMIMVIFRDHSLRTRTPIPVL
jgi:hypothetical protein